VPAGVEKELIFLNWRGAASAVVGLVSLVFGLGQVSRELRGNCFLSWGVEVYICLAATSQTTGKRQRVTPELLKCRAPAKHDGLHPSPPAVQRGGAELHNDLVAAEPFDMSGCLVILGFLVRSSRVNEFLRFNR